MIETLNKENYHDLSERQRKEWNEFEGIFFAFSNSQFYKGMEKVGLDPKDTSSVSRLGATGGFIVKNRSQAFNDMRERHEAELSSAFESEEFLLQSLVYELKNHEYGYTYDITDALENLGLLPEDVPSDILEKAKILALKGEGWEFAF